MLQATLPSGLINLGLTTLLSYEEPMLTDCTLAKPDSWSMTRALFPYSIASCVSCDWEPKVLVLHFREA